MICLKESFHREKKDEKTFLLCGLTFPQGRLHREKKD
jgi:hypothetical protein